MAFSLNVASHTASNLSFFTSRMLTSLLEFHFAGPLPTDISLEVSWDLGRGTKILTGCSKQQDVTREAGPGARLNHRLTNQSEMASVGNPTTFSRLRGVAEGNQGAEPPCPVGRVRLGMMNSTTSACTVRPVGGRLGMMDRNIR